MDEQAAATRPKRDIPIMFDVTEDPAFLEPAMDGSVAMIFTGTATFSEKREKVTVHARLPVTMLSEMYLEVVLAAMRARQRGMVPGNEWSCLEGWEVHDAHTRYGGNPVKRQMLDLVEMLLVEHEEKKLTGDSATEGEIRFREGLLAVRDAVVNGRVT